MAKKKIDRVRVTKNKETPVDRFLRLGRAFSNKRQVLYKGDDSLWFAIHIWTKYISPDFYEYMNECIEYDKAHKNHKRINEWEELLSQGLTVEKLKEWANEEYKKEWHQLMIDVENQIKNTK